jgi:hypothetical protein
MLLPEDWRTFIESLNSNGVEYVVVGAVALAHHGFPRYMGAQTSCLAKMKLSAISRQQ